MKKIGLFILFGIVIFSSCKKDRKEVSTSELSNTSTKKDTLNLIKRIDVKSKKVITLDVLQYFTEDELPNIFRLAGVAYIPYAVNNDLVKLKLVFEGGQGNLNKDLLF